MANIDDAEFSKYKKRLENLVEKRTSDLKKAHEQLTTVVEIKEKYQMLVEKMEEGVTLEDPEGIITFVNPNVTNLLGYTEDELVGKHWSFIVPPEDQKKAEIETAKRPMGESSTYESSILAKDRTRIPIIVSATPLFSPTGEYEGVLVVSTDITELKRAEEKLKLDEERLKALLKLSQLTDVSEKDLSDYALEECVRLTQSDVGYLHFFNEDEKTIQLYTWSKSALTKCTTEKNPHYPLGKAGVWADCVRLKKPVIHNDYQNLSKKKGYPEGHFPVTRHMSVPVFDGDTIVAVAGVGNKKNLYDESDSRQLTLFMDSLWRVLKQKRSEDALIRSNEELRHKSSEMEEFVYTISHDLKSPLISVLGFINLINVEFEKELPEGLNFYITRIEKNIEQMGNIITDVLEYSKIGRLSEEKEVYPLKELINDVVTGFLPRLSAKKISIEIEDTLPYVYVVKRRFIQVFENLIDNAIKYMGNEEKTKEIEIGINEIKRNFITIFVRDTGIGIKKEYFPKLFQLFSRIPSGYAEEVMGSGIGLANVKKIIETHGGSVWVDSEVGKGTAFYFDIPLPPTKV